MLTSEKFLKLISKNLRKSYIQVITILKPPLIVIGADIINAVVRKQYNYDVKIYYFYVEIYF